ncbi:MAG TPA: DUF177 domain-containing protein [Syntrophorhabdaceae bacterium]|nr:DUF177 domain-containing protein [Syntrophorhabdaceae bacterium]HPU29381.1 DUF177 domain-containing protein [Syntrophorhabdaceae bacterium]
MIIKLLDIEDNFVLKGNLEMATLSNACKLASPVHYELVIKKNKDTLSIKGNLDCIVYLTCSRCLDEFPYMINTKVDFKMMSQDLAPHEPELELKRDEMDIYYYEGNEIELEPILNEEIMLNIPIKPLCKESCKGLCQVCGKNMNYEQCDCSKSLDTVLGEKLKNFLN